MKQVGKRLIIIAGHQLILAARKKLHEVAQELAGLGQAPVFFQFQARQVAAEQDPVVDLFQRQAVRVHFFQQHLAERMERGQHYILATFSGRFHHSRLHLARSFACERQTENVFAQERGVRFQEVADAFCNDARFSGARAGNYQKRAFAVGDGAPLRFIRLKLRTLRASQIKKSSHRLRVTCCGANRKRRLAPHTALAFNSDSTVSRLSLALACLRFQIRKAPTTASTVRIGSIGWR
jgi:hypothetical protein